jgi:hypothetical protein
MTIDGQLAEAGWLVQSREQMNRSAGLGVAVREFGTASGPVDYALFVGGSLCGGVKAKPDFPQTGDAQSPIRVLETSRNATLRKRLPRVKPAGDEC